MSGRSQLAADDDQQLSLVQLQHETRLGFDEVRILIAAGERFDRDFVATDFADNRGQVGGGRNDVDGGTRRRGD